MAPTFLKVEGREIVDGDGKPVILRGTALGGWLNMENFITGYPGQEFQHRAAMRRTLGQEKSDYFFSKFLEYFFTAKDAEYLASLNVNCVRVPFNYRHFEDDMNPRVLKAEGFKYLDAVISLCASQSIYTILDMHSVPGCQNGDWHSDNPTNHAFFWDHKDFQDRTVWLWEEIAKRYCNNPWIAGYNPINEPADPEHFRLPAFYERLEKAIRLVDPNHILFLDGNTYAMEWRHFDRKLPNCVYAIHDYSSMGFPSGTRYRGTPEQTTQLEKSYLRKAEFMTKHACPVWNGEFGPVYQDPLTPDAHSINHERINMLKEQLRIYTSHRVHWSIWLYKDIGMQGIVHTSPTSKWNTTIAPFLSKKKQYQLDGWGWNPSKESQEAMAPLVEWIDQISPEAKKMYPSPWPTRRKIQRAVFHTFLADSFSNEFARLFVGMAFEDLDALAHSFHFDECVRRTELEDVLREST